MKDFKILKRKGVKEKMRRNRKAQSTLEYVIVLGVVIAAIIAFATGTFRTKLGNALDNVTNEMVNVVGRIHY